MVTSSPARRDSGRRGVCALSPWPQWIYNSGSKATTQNLCDCYPPNYYNPFLGSNGGGTSYLSVSGTIAFVEGISSGSGVGSFYMENSCDPNHSLYVYQDGAAGRTVTMGDYVTIQVWPPTSYRRRNLLSHHLIILLHPSAGALRRALRAFRPVELMTNGLPRAPVDDIRPSRTPTTGSWSCKTR